MCGRVALAGCGCGLGTEPRLGCCRVLTRRAGGRGVGADGREAGRAAGRGRLAGTVPAGSRRRRGPRRLFPCADGRGLFLSIASPPPPDARRDRGGRRDGRPGSYPQTSATDQRTATAADTVARRTVSTVPCPCPLSVSGQTAGRNCIIGATGRNWNNRPTLGNSALRELGMELATSSVKGNVPPLLWETKLR